MKVLEAQNFETGATTPTQSSKSEKWCTPLLLK